MGARNARREVYELIFVSSDGLPSDWGGLSCCRIWKNTDQLTHASNHRAVYIALHCTASIADR